MPQPTQFPNREADLLSWFQHLIAGLTPAPLTYNVTTAQLTQLTSLTASYQSALAAAGPAVRSKPATMAKNAARDAVKDYCRLVINSINASQTVSDSQKLALGLTVRATPVSRPIPEYAPALSVGHAPNGLFELTVSDSQVVGKRGKPVDVATCTLFSHVGETAPTSVEAFKFEGTTSRTTFQVEIPASVAPGSAVWFTAFWSNNKGQSGPACAPVKGFVQFGGMSKAA